MSRHLKPEHRRAARFKPEPDDPDSALFYYSDITIKFPCDSVEREVIDLSGSGLKVFLEDKDPLIDHIGTDIKAILSLGKKEFSVVLNLIHQTENDYGLAYLGCRFTSLKEEVEELIIQFLEGRQKEKDSKGKK